MVKNAEISVIDLFAGPGGLGEGFESFTDTNGHKVFRICLSIEMNDAAHRTLLTRSFFRQFSPENVPDDYYKYLRSELSRDQLFENYPEEFEKANDVAWKAELGKTPHKMVSKRINSALGKNKIWVLLGGPPCQAYSLVGRSRMINTDKEKYETDPRHYLYKEYVQIIADHRPPIFIMENVKGLLSSKLNDKNAFELILTDLGDPVTAVNTYGRKRSKADKKVLYKIYPLTRKSGLFANEPRDYLIEAENLGLPQKRHRVFLLGIRSDLNITPDEIESLTETQTTVNDVICDLPQIRSGLSKNTDNIVNWIAAIQSIKEQSWFGKKLPEKSRSIWKEMRSVIKNISKLELEKGEEYFKSMTCEAKKFSDWFTDKRLNGVINHTSRSHIIEDLYRYLFAACFAKIIGRSPRLRDFPSELLPAHKSAIKGVKGELFADRFHVQLHNKPSSTIVSHISKDGHYFIHPDPNQCRSLTVREAARLQTFPDNYLFEGGRTNQYQQVGNAVPPLLAKQIAAVVYKLIEQL
ncbi:MAG: DNA cytosine methyltransferase [Pyrinomonadaceae bacterium]|nr:DNA cytosine methyltransferase [Pyrinomonadaceae bacterium]